jgi:uncharacterized Fe-S cluster protein YjdI
MRSMSLHLQTYESSELTVTFDPRVCTHSGTCVRGLPAVFDAKRKPWVEMGGATADAIAEQVGRCPSGALRAVRKSAP